MTYLWIVVVLLVSHSKNAPTFVKVSTGLRSIDHSARDEPLMAATWWKRPEIFTKT